MKIALVVGHSVDSPGACSPHLGICEFEYNNTFVDDIINEYHGEHELLKIMRTEYKDLPDHINNKNPDYIISFHCNAFNTYADGTETLYYNRSMAGKKLAEDIQSRIVKVLELDNRGTKPKGREDRGGYLLKYTKAPCVIIEPFFIDNYFDLNRAILRNNELRDTFINMFNEFKL